MMENPRKQISDLHFDEFADTSDFQCWKTNFKIEECSCSGCLTVAMLWINEVEVANSVDDLKTSHSIEGHVFPDFEMLDAKVASALKRMKRTITNQYFRRRTNVEELEYRFLRGRQIACMIYEHFRATGAHDAALDLADFFNIYLHDDDIQDFDIRWDQALSAASETPLSDCLGSFVQDENTRVCSASDSIDYARPRN